MVDNFEELFSFQKDPYPFNNKDTSFIKDNPTYCDRNTGIVQKICNRRKSVGFSDFGVFYHIAAINDWKNVIIEQKNVCDKLGLKPMCGILGEHQDKEWAESIGLDIRYHSTNLYEYESPTLKLLYDWSKNNPSGCVLYFHSKGVSAPNDMSKKYWRWLMTQQVILEYQDNLKRLEIADIVGVDWQESPHFPHFSGNFWMSRCDWINILDDPLDFQRHNGPSIAGHPWVRMSAEMWVGSKGWHIIDSLCCKNYPLWKEDSIFYNQYKK